MLRFGVEIRAGAALRVGLRVAGGGPVPAACGLEASLFSSPPAAVPGSISIPICCGANLALSRELCVAARRDVSMEVVSPSCSNTTTSRLAFVPNVADIALCRGLGLKSGPARRCESVCAMLAAARCLRPAVWRLRFSPALQPQSPDLFQSQYVVARTSH